METYNYNPAEKHLPLENFNVLFLEGNELYFLYHSSSPC